MYEMGLPGIASQLADRLPFLSPSLRVRVVCVRKDVKEEQKENI